MLYASQTLPGVTPNITNERHTMNKPANLLIGYAVVVLIVAAANLMHPHPLYWGAWAVLAVLGVLNVISYRRATR
ncbi:hypothetical protein [Glutamicibacter arilaitensis]|uniref:hypothetical protein n=1 Tax=Glutamicibacter arilaitensis TaxID=256701 RepID=UPI003F927BD5